MAVKLIPTTEAQNMDSNEMVRRAAETGAKLETYDPTRLVAEVCELLTDRGLHPDIPPGTGRAGMAAGAAGQLLRALGILPAGGAESIDRLNAPDPDSR